MSSLLSNSCSSTGKGNPLEAVQWFTEREKKTPLNLLPKVNFVTPPCFYPVVIPLLQVQDWLRSLVWTAEFEERMISAHTTPGKACNVNQPSVVFTMGLDGGAISHMDSRGACGGQEGTCSR